MSGLKELRNRINSIRSTKKITKAMQVVSAAKLKKIKEQAEKFNHFSSQLGNVMNNISKYAVPVDLPEEDRVFFAPEMEELPKLLVVMTSERGLCGGFNSQIVRAVKRDIEIFKAENKKVFLLVIGKKGHDALQVSYPDLIQGYIHLGKEDLSCIAMAIRRRIAQMIESKKVGHCYLYYNKFKNAMTQVATTVRIIPAVSNVSVNQLLNGNHSGSKQEKAKPEQFGSSSVDSEKFSSGVVLPGSSSDDYSGDAYEYEGYGLVRDVINLYLTGQIKYGLLQNKASEEGARMTAMDNATRNAADLIDKLKLELNRSRQSSITTELTEIISGAEAV